jgi:CHAT domain-containing protein/tetratricopeptide (TPR) repeat protein
MGPSELLGRLLTGIEILKQDAQSAIVLVSEVPDFIDAHLEILSLTFEEEIARRRMTATAEDDRLAAVLHILQLCRRPEGVALLRPKAEISVNLESGNRSGELAFGRVTPDLEQHLSEGGMLRRLLASTREAILQSGTGDPGLQVLAKGLAVLWPVAAGMYLAITLGEAGVLWAQRRWGDRGENLERAIECFEDLLTCHARETDSETWADINNNVGTAYMERLEGDRVENLERAISFITKALGVTRRETHPSRWAKMCRNLGSAFLQQRAWDRGENIERAIRLYEESLNIAIVETDARDWAQTYNNLGLAYAKRLQGDPAENIERAIDWYRDALSDPMREADARSWAITLNNLGVTLLSRIRGGRSENIEQAISYLNNAMKIITKDADSHGWAEICNHLGMSYVYRVADDRAENLETAIRYYEDALEVLTPETDPHGWAQICQNLGSVYVHRSDGNRSRNLEKAISYSEDALTVWTPARDRQRWAATCVNIGAAYAQLSQDDRGKSLEKAITFYEDAAKVLTRDADLIDWASVRRNLGSAYARRIDGDPVDNLKQAIRYFEDAVPVLQLVRPWTALNAMTRLGRLRLDIGRREAAREVWRAALEFREAQLLAATSLATRADALEGSDDLAAELACLEVTLGLYGAAVATLERGKAIGLRKALGLDEAWLAGLAEEQRVQIVQSHAQLLDLRASQVEVGATIDPVLLRASETEISAAHAALDAVLANAQFTPQSVFDAAALGGLAPEGGAIVLLAAATHGGIGFVLPAGCSKVSEEHAVALPEATRSAMRGLLAGWDRAYQAVTGNQGRTSFLGANAALEAMLDGLWLQVMGPIAAKLVELGVKPGAELVLLPQGDLALLPLHAAWRMVEKQRRAVLDDYIVSYTPSGAVLATARERLTLRKAKKVFGSSEHGQNFFGVFNPSMDQSLTEAERSELPALRSLFAERGHLVCTCIGHEATVQRVLSEVSKVGYIHFSCHGRFDQDAPEKSGLVLADKPLTVPDIVQNMRLPRCRLVTLAACETGVVDVVHVPDEFTGLPAAFLQAGAPGVSATFWKVLDHATATLFSRFFAIHMEDGQNTPAAALRKAVIWLRDIAIIDQERKRNFSVLAEEAALGLSPNGLNTGRLFQLPIVWAAYAHHGT